MKKAIIIGVVAFLVALAASTALGVMRGRKAASAAALIVSAHADSVTARQVADSAARHDSTDKPGHGDSSAVAQGAHDSTPAELPTTHAAPNPVGAAPKIIPASTVDPAAKADAYKQVARVLSAMKAVEAAKVLAFLSDDEVEGILRSVGPRQAADFMTNLPKERAAGLSRRLLVPKPKEQGR